MPIGCSDHRLRVLVFKRIYPGGIIFILKYFKKLKPAGAAMNWSRLCEAGVVRKGEKLEFKGKTVKVVAEIVESFEIVFETVFVFDNFFLEMFVRNF